MTDRRADLAKARDNDALTGVAKDIAIVQGVLNASDWNELVKEGIAKRAELGGASEEPIPD